MIGTRMKIWIGKMSRTRSVIVLQSAMDSSPDYRELRYIQRLANEPDRRRVEAYEKVFNKLYKKQREMVYQKKVKTRKFKSWNGKLFGDQVEHLKKLAETSGESEALHIRQALDAHYGLPKKDEEVR